MTSIDDRMKELEHSTRSYLPRRSYTMIRLDGKCFHSFTRRAKKPFDPVLIAAMSQTTKYLCENIQGCKIGYTQSDEISLVLADFDSIKSEPWMKGNLQKIVSISASMATAFFNTYDFPFTNSLAIFDSRAWTISDPWEVYNTFLWRQQDCTKNSIQMVARSHYSHKELMNKKYADLHEMIYKKGDNFDSYPTHCKRGTFVVKENGNWVIDQNAPILTQDKNYFFSRLPLIPQPDMSAA